MTPSTCVLDNVEFAYELVAESLREAPQLYDCHLDQALLVLVLATKRTRRSRNLRKPRQPVARKLTHSAHELKDGFVDYERFPTIEFMGAMRAKNAGEVSY